MSSTATQERVVVGIDGSQNALHAAVWATEVALREHLPIQLLAVHEPVAASGQDPVLRDELERQHVQDAHVHLAQAGDVVRHAIAAAQAPGGATEIRTEMRTGNAFTVLLEAAGPAALLVFGARTSPSTSDAIVTTAALIARSRCPVAVVGHRPHPARGPVVVGVRSGDEPGVLDYAFRQARARGIHLRALHCAPNGQVPSSASDAARRLDSWLRPATALHPAVVVEPVVTHHPPSPALIEQSSSADLLVIGRGTRAPSGLLGATAAAVLLHAACPVVFV
ncbi:MAG: universal stress protein [Rhodococcus sp. (in: high G+C Gram-positive bacteria)]